jgi:hypothetical protein
MGKAKRGRTQSKAYIALCGRKMEEARKAGNTYGVAFWKEQRNCNVEFAKRLEKK